MYLQRLGLHCLTVKVISSFFLAMAFIAVFSLSAWCSGERYKPGDVIEVFRNNVNGWETAIVVPYLSSDFPAGRGNYCRVWIPTMPTITEGVEITVKDTRPGQAANLAEIPERFSENPPDAALPVLKALGRTWPRNRTSSPQSAVSAGTRATAARSLVSSPVSPLPQTNNNQADLSSKPVVLGSLPQLPGTTWKQLSDRKTAVVVPLHLFCRSGRWEVVRDNFVGGGMMGSYRIEGSKLILKSSTDGKSDTYSMSYDAGQKLLLLTNNSVTLRLLYRGTTECK
ncbi:hypothetical protein KBI23_11910 [bacterium]|nr:hypothetical protein [bacterium]MBP9808627.1 hypothetical protein [bacterium]